VHVVVILVNHNLNIVAIIVNPNKICKKLVCGDYDTCGLWLLKWVPSIDHLREKYRVGGKVFHSWKMA